MFYENKKQKTTEIGAERTAYAQLRKPKSIRVQLKWVIKRMVWPGGKVWPISFVGGSSSSEVQKDGKFYVPDSVESLHQAIGAISILGDMMGQRSFNLHEQAEEHVYDSDGRPLGGESSVRDSGRCPRLKSFHTNLGAHPNPLISALSSHTHPLNPPRRLKRRWPRDLLGDWGGACQNGESQSPIDIDLDAIPERPEPTEPILFINYDENVGSYTVYNNGHTVSVRVEQPCRIAVGGGGLNGLYLLDHIHFHWGSEHTVNHKRFPAEVHLVHFNKIYRNISEALKHPRGVAVIGIFLDDDEDDIDNAFLQPLLSVASATVENEENKLKVNILSLDHLLPKETSDFYRYDGSLTTPPCTETVVWSLMKDASSISRLQVKLLNDIHLSHGVNNFRPTQPLNERRVSLMSSHMSLNGLYGTIKYSPKQSSASTNSLVLPALVIALIALAVT
ncbi:hypothetical protein AAG570_004585 [Ranatra chinensis]|uniref:Carbonic anhydrase n=1 Tax=Ranatra chinensis TaxID=642074 RepID=A0ABD0YJG6_9HEMI